jgi:hypothetical protein
MAGISDRNAPEWAIGMRRNRRSEWPGLRNSLAFWKLIGFEPVFIVTELTL